MDLARMSDKELLAKTEEALALLDKMLVCIDNLEAKVKLSLATADKPPSPPPTPDS